MMIVARTCEVNKGLCLVLRLTEIPNELTRWCAARACQRKKKSFTDENEVQVHIQLSHFEAYFRYAANKKKQQFKHTILQRSYELICRHKKDYFA